MNPAELQILGSRLASIADEMGAVLRRAASSPNIKERADCSAAVFTARGRAPRAGRAHPGAPRFDAGVGRGRHRRGARSRRGRRPDAQRPLRGRHAPERPHDGRARARRRRARRLGGQPRAPRRRRWHRSRVDAARCADRRRGGTASPADAGRRRLAGASGAARRAPPTNGAATSTRSAAPTASARRAWRSSCARSEASTRAAGCSPRSSTTASGGCGPRCATSPTVGSPPPTCSIRPAPDPSSRRRPAIVVEVRVDGDEITFDFTGTDAQRPGNVNAVEAVTVSAVAFAIRAVSDPTLPANGGTLRPGARGGAAGHRGRRGAAGRGRCRQRGGEPTRRRRLPRGARRGPTRARRRREPGHDEQRPARRR